MLLVWMLLTGCEALEDGGTASSGQENCPDGLAAARAAELVFSTFSHNGLTSFPSFTAGATYDAYDGATAACVNGEGTRAQWIFEVGGEAFGAVTIGAPAAGTYDLNGDEQELAIALDGAQTPVTFTRGTDFWQDGSWNISSVGPMFQAHVQGTATGANQSLYVGFSAEASP